MPQPATWKIYDGEGRYLAQHRAFAAETAFVHYLACSGEAISQKDLTVSDATGVGLVCIIYKTLEYVLTDDDTSFNSSKSPHAVFRD